MNIAWAMTTAPRPRPTIDASLASFRAAGFSDRINVFADDSQGMPRLADNNYTMVASSPAPLGNLRNWARSLRHMVAENPKADFIGMMQDDILWAQRSAEVLYTEIEAMGHLALGAGYLSLYMFERHVEERRRASGLTTWRNWYTTLYGRKSPGAQCYVVPRSSAVALLHDAQFQYHIANNPHYGDDRVVSNCLDDMGLPLWLRVPPLVSHEMGRDNSTMSHKVPPDAMWQEEATLYGS